MAKRKIAQHITIAVLSGVMICFFTIVWQRHFAAMEGTKIQDVLIAYYAAIGEQDVVLTKQYLIIGDESGPNGSFAEGKIERIIAMSQYAPEGSYPPTIGLDGGIGVKLGGQGRAYTFGWVKYQSDYIDPLRVWLRYRDGQWKIYRLYDFSWPPIEND